ncbi:hypothetical protein E2562_003589 [Oryza meyeriana var. granulata]|uniref:Uncharacterized protein n=1 Tax=Oryza meyeriana var. granulata TaxID=110450 RepID=A0A6G1CMC9_9ORYZ|nr:hypothetical protein E2562_003589 [Oryza meyeriana var. granulata]
MALPIHPSPATAAAGCGGGRRGLPPPLAVLHHQLSASDPSPTHHAPLPTPQLPLPPRVLLLPFAVPARSFSWYSRSSPSGPGAEEKAPEEEVHAEWEGVDLRDAGSVDYGEVVASAAGTSADAIGVGTAGDGGGASGFSVSSLIDLLDGFHNLTGIPWWITISLSTVAMRLLILPVLITQIKKAAKIGELLPELPPPLPPPLSGRSFRDQFSLYQTKRRELGCPSFLWNWAYFSVQFPCFILWMSTIRTMCLSNHPGLDNGGILWFHNLTEFPHGSTGLIFPTLVAGLHYLNIQIAFHGTQTKHYPGIFGLLAKYYRVYLDILTIPLFLIAYVIPQGSQVYWTTNGLITVAQQLSLRNDSVKKMLGLPDTRVHQKSSRVGHRMMQQWPLEDAHMHTNLTSPDNETANNIMEGKVSELSSPEELLEQALQHLETGFRDQAIPLIRTAIEKDPNLHIALIGMGQALFSNRLFPEATVCFEHAIPKIEEQDPLLVLACYGAGLSRMQQGDNKMAIEILQRLAELKEPEKNINKQCYFRGLVALGSILINEGRKSEAIKLVQRAVAYDPGCEIYLKQCYDATEDKPKSAEH